MHFETPALAVRELRSDEIPALQALFEASPGYFLLVDGRPPSPDEAQREFDERPPAPLGFTRQYFMGVYDRPGRLQGVLIVVSDFCATGVWHIALFFLADALHGTGAAAGLHAALERWAARAGARWLRLGVVVGNAAAEKFWRKCGYLDVRTRESNDAAGRSRTVRVLVKPLAGGTLAEYLDAVARDVPGSELSLP